MVDSCLKAFKFKCFRKSAVVSIQGSHESIFQSDKSLKALDNDKILNFTTCAAPIAVDNDLELEHGVVFRRHNRTYLHSISTTTSYDAMSSGDEADEVGETLDVLYPLPRAKTHERPLAEETNNRPGADDKNGKWIFYKPCNALENHREYRHTHSTFFLRFATDKINSRHCRDLKDHKSDAAGRTRHTPSLLRKLLRRKQKQKVKNIQR